MLEDVKHSQCIALFDASNIDQFVWPDTVDGKKGRDYLYPLIKEGVKPYLTNVSTKMYLVVYQDLFLPFTINEREYENSYVASNYYALKFYEEIVARKYPRLMVLQKPLLFLGGLLLKLFKINKTLFLNNWLITSSLVPRIAQEELKVIVDFLVKKFPEHTIIFRNVDALMKKDLLHSLKNSKFHLLKTREIYFYNPATQVKMSNNVRKTCRRDLKILENLNLKIVSSEEIQEGDYSRLRTLYEMLYVDKYTKYSPRYSEKFLKNTHQKKMVTYVALKSGDVIEGFFSYFVYDGVMINCLFGYNTSLSYSHDLYKILTRLVVDESIEKGLILNDGSGGDVAKRQRGLRPFPEYMGLYNTHLAMPRRVLWDIAAFLHKKMTPKDRFE